MPERDDIELLAEYVEQNSEEAFGTLVACYVNLVYSVALRHVSNLHEAEEITQAVFIILARKARVLAASRHRFRRVVLSGWLYHTARLTAANSVRSESRRARREQQAYMQSMLNEPETDPWPHIAPLVDTAMADLSGIDRDAIVLRFFQNRNLRDVGVALGVSEEAAKKRVQRALDKLRDFFARRGIAPTAPMLGAALAANSVHAAPANLTASITATAFQGAAVHGSTITLVKGALKIMAWSKAKTAIVCGIAAVLVIGTTTATVKAVASNSDKHGYNGTTKIELSGTDGAPFEGFYVLEGRKVSLSSTVPFSFAQKGISSFELHKVRTADSISVAMRYEGKGMHSEMTKHLVPGLDWLGGRVRNGFIVTASRLPVNGN